MMKQVLFATAACLLACTSLSAAQDPYVFGAVTGGYIGPILQGNDGVGTLGARLGLGQEWDHGAVEGQLAYYTFAFDGEIAEGGLVVPSVTAKYLFGEPEDQFRFNAGAGVDYVLIMDLSQDNFSAFGLPWAHLNAGVDYRLNEDSDLFFEARTYGLVTVAHIGARFGF